MVAGNGPEDAYSPGAQEQLRAKVTPVKTGPDFRKEVKPVQKADESPIKHTSKDLTYSSPGRQAVESFWHELWRMIEEVRRVKDKDSNALCVLGSCEETLKLAEECLQTKLLGLRILPFPSYDKAWNLLYQVEIQLLQLLPLDQLKMRIAALQTRLPYVKTAKQREHLNERLKGHLTNFEHLIKDSERKPAKDPERQTVKEQEVRSDLQYIARTVDGWRQEAWWKINLYKNRLLIFAGLLLAMGLALAKILDPSWDIAVIMGFGALGGILSGLRGIEALLEKTIETYYVKRREAFLRPIVGATAALVLYAVARSGLLLDQITKTVDTNLWSFLPFAFAAGFSESFFIRTIERVTAKASEGPEEELPEKRTFD